MSAAPGATEAVLLVALVAATSAAGLRSARRRRSLNTALHELRRPLHAMALAGGDHHGSMSLAVAALDRLERDINGGSARRLESRIALARVLDDAVARWRPRAREAGATLTLVDATRGLDCRADPIALAQALDNLIVNSIEHGGTTIGVTARRHGSNLLLTVTDSGPGPAGGRSGTRRPLADRVIGRSRRGHGLRVVRRIAGKHGGHFRLERGPSGARAVIELPIGHVGAVSAQ